jgi:hypothetical protein
MHFQRALALAALHCAASAAALLAWPATLRANVVLGVPSSSTFCEVALGSIDLSCSFTTAPGSGLDEATARVTGEASARHAGGQGGAGVELIASETFPLSITRTISFSDGVAFVPILELSIDVLYDGVVAASVYGFDMYGAVAGDAQLDSVLFGPSNTLLGVGLVNSGTEVPFSASDFLSDVAAANFSGPSAGEIDDLADIPEDFRMWEDRLPPFASDFASGEVEQTLVDSLTVSFRLRAESRPLGSASTGGASIACAGQLSELLDFEVPAAGCGEGVVVQVRAVEIGTQEVLLTPEPGVAVGGIALAMLLALRIARGRRS